MSVGPPPLPNLGPRAALDQANERIRGEERYADGMNALREQRRLHPGPLRRLWNRIRGTTVTEPTD